MATESDGMSGAEGRGEPKRARPKKAKPVSKAAHKRPAKVPPEPMNQSSGASRRASPGRRKPSTPARKSVTNKPAQRSPEGDNPRTDLQLLEEARGGNRRAFAAIYERHRAPLLDLARGWTRSKHDAEDLVEDVFLWLLRSLPSLEVRGSLPGLLSKVAADLLVDGRRAETRRSKREGIHAARAGASEDPEVGRDVRDILNSLAPFHRRVLVLRHLERRTVPEIAELLGKPEGTVKWWIHMALCTLRQKTEFCANERGGS